MPQYFDDNYYLVPVFVTEEGQRAVVTKLIKKAHLTSRKVETARQDYEAELNVLLDPTDASYEVVAKPRTEARHFKDFESWPCNME